MIEVFKKMVEALECALSEDKPYIDECKQAIQAGKQAIAELESQEPLERDWREAPWGFGEKRLSTVEYSDIVSDGGLDPRNKFDTPPQRTWVDLTDDERYDIRAFFVGQFLETSEFAEQVQLATEAKLKEKNT